MKKLIFTLATVAVLGGCLGQASAAKADLSISATIPTGGPSIGIVAAPPPPVYVEPVPVVRAPMYADYRAYHDDYWKHHHDRRWDHHHDRFDHRHDHRDDRRY